MKLLRILSTKDLDEVNEFLWELKDGAAYRARLKALEDRKKEINALIEVYGKVKEIEGLNLKARQLKEGVDNLVAAAQADRADARDEAEETIRSAKSSASDIVRDAKEKFAERERTLVEGETVLGQLEKAHAMSLDDLTKREHEAGQAKEAGLVMFGIYKDAVDALKVAIEKIAKAL
jgi:ribosomal protein L17